MASEHGADEAGGEVIYSYEGCDPIVVTKPPVPTTTTSTTTTAAVVDTDGVSPSIAFEAFAGKVYKPASFLSAFGVVGGGGGGSSSYNNKEETALERLGRLQYEISQIEQDLNRSSNSCSSSIGNNNADAGAGDDADGTTTNNNDAGDDYQDGLIMAVQELKLRLARVAVIPPQESLTAQVQSVASSIAGAAASAGTINNNTPSKPPPQHSTSTTPGGALRMGNLSTTVSVESRNAALERRLQRLEKWVGASSSSLASSESISLQERLRVLEETLSKLDDKEMEAKAKKAKVIRQDLEAASKARNKLLAASGSSSSSSTNNIITSGTGGGSIGASASDSKIISELHSHYVQLHGLTPHLPSLAQRLQALSRQHQEAALQSQQLHSTQELATALMQHVAQLERAVETTQTALEETAQQMAHNMTLLDAKLSSNNH